MKLRLLILLAAAALAAAPAAGQTIKSLGYNTTNGQIVYSGSNSLTFTNALQFSTNARAATRTNLGGTTLGNSVFTATNTAAAQIAVLGTNAEINTSGGLVGLTLSTNETKLLNPISFPFLGGATAAATSRTNLGLGAADSVTFSNITANGILNANDSTATPATNAAAAQGIQWSGLGGSQHAAIYGGYPGAAQIALAVGASSNALSDVATFRSTGMTVSSNAIVGGTLAVTGNVTMSGVNNTAPSQTASSASSLMTRDLVDARAGRRFVLRATNDLTANSTTFVTNSQTVTLPAGTYAFFGAMFASTASTTGGLQAEIVPSNGSIDYVSGFSTRATVSSLNGGSATPVMVSRVGNDLFQYLCASIADAPVVAALSEMSGSVLFEDTVTILMRVAQRSATDTNNPVTFHKGSFIEFVSITE